MDFRWISVNTDATPHSQNCCRLQSKLTTINLSSTKNDDNIAKLSHLNSIVNTAQLIFTAVSILSNQNHATTDLRYDHPAVRNIMTLTPFYKASQHRLHLQTQGRRYRNWRAWHVKSGVEINITSANLNFDGDQVGQTQFTESVTQLHHHKRSCGTFWTLLTNLSSS